MTDSVVICIPTYKRPKMLKRLLDAIVAQETNAVLTVLVADNDAEGRAKLGALMSTSRLVTSQACESANRKNNPVCSDAFGATMVSVEEVK